MKPYRGRVKVLIWLAGAAVAWAVVQIVVSGLLHR